METNSRIYVAGHRGLVGSALVRALRTIDCHNLVLCRRDQLDLRDEAAVKWLFSVHRPEFVFVAAARVGGIKANLEQPVEFLCDNLKIQQNILLNAAEYGVRKLVFLGSNCIYPQDSPVPIKESALLTGSLHPSNEGYALAKIAGIKLCQYLRRARGCNFVCAMPCNIFGPGDSLDPERSHVVAGLMVKMHRAKHEGADRVFVWGDGTARRELLFSDDLADALICIMDRYNDAEPINVGGTELSIAAIAERIARVMELTCPIEFDVSQPVGVQRKLLDGSKMAALGWKPAHDLDQALRITSLDVAARLSLPRPE